MGMAELWASPYRVRVLQLAAIWALTYVCSQTVITFWKEFAISERGFTAEAVGGAISVAALVAMPAVFAVGKLLDVFGRRKVAVLVFLALSLGGLGSYQLSDPTLLRLSLIVGMFGTSAVLPVLNAWSTELFPTEVRGEAFGWANNLLGRVTYVLAPMLVASGAASLSWGLSASLTTIGPILALVLILLWMPETQNQELEKTASL
jgi:putative MFS transporter